MMRLPVISYSDWRQLLHIATVFGIILIPHKQHDINDIDDDDDDDDWWFDDTIKSDITKKNYLLNSITATTITLNYLQLQIYIVQQILILHQIIYFIEFFQGIIPWVTTILLIEV